MPLKDPSVLELVLKSNLAIDFRAELKGLFENESSGNGEAGLISESVSKGESLVVWSITSIIFFLTSHQFSIILIFLVC